MRKGGVFTTGTRRNKRTRDAHVDERYSDSGPIFAIVKHLRKYYRIRMGQIRQECTVEFTRRGRKIHGEHMNHIDISVLSKTRLIHTPDIVVTDQDGELVLIIELDGSIHESRDVAARDRRRNRHYADSGVHFIVINTARLRRSRKNLFTYLDEEMERVGWPRKKLHRWCARPCAGQVAVSNVVIH